MAHPIDSICRNCKRRYASLRSQSWFNGYCTMRCLRAKAKYYGCKADKDIFDTLHRVSEIGQIKIKAHKNVLINNALRNGICFK